MKTAAMMVAAAAVALCTATHAAGGGVAEAMAKGVRYLKTRQAEDGHFSDAQMPALTALPLWALVRGGEGRGESAKKAAAFVLGMQRPDGGFYVPKPGRGGAGLGNYNTSVCVSALFESGLAPAKAILDARTYIAGSQLTGDDTMAGGFGYDRASRRRYADLSNTSYAMDAMRRTEGIEDLRPKGQSRADLNWEQALKFVARLQETAGERAGGAVYNDRTPQAGTSTNRAGRVQLRAYGSMSYAAVLSMCHAKLTRSDPRVKSALEYCTRFWTLDENPGMGSQGLYYYYDILSRALSAAGVEELVQDDGRKVRWKAELAARLISLQRPDGSWVNDNNRFWEGDPVLATSFAVLALSMCE
jgi:squalene-hopene/tetraprenyl-beta-curcumene cyclase